MVRKDREKDIEKIKWFRKSSGCRHVTLVLSNIIVLYIKF